MGFRKVNHVWAIPFALARLGLIRAALRRADEARGLFQEGLALAATLRARDRDDEAAALAAAARTTALAAGAAPLTARAAVS